jgi:hypothetical protein
MLWRIFLTLTAMWVVGVVTGMTLHGYIHVFILLALLVAVVSSFARGETYQIRRHRPPPIFRIH